MTESTVNQAERTVMKPTIFIRTLLGPLTASAQNQITIEKVDGAKRAEVFEQTLPNLDYRNVEAITAEYASGGTSPKHRHDVAVFAYVLEGSACIQDRKGNHDE